MASQGAPGIPVAIAKEAPTLTRIAAAEGLPALELPPTLRRRLSRIDGRRRVSGLAVAIGRAGLACAAVGLVGMGADFWFELPAAVRWTVWGLGVGLPVAVVVVAALRALAGGRRHRDWLGLAALAERGRGVSGEASHGESATQAASLAGSGSGLHGSPALAAAAIARAEREAAAIDPGRALPLAPAGRRFLAGAAALLALLAPAVVWPESLGRMLGRYVAPWASIERVTPFAIVLRGDSERTIAAGDDLVVTAEVRPRFGLRAPASPLTLTWTDGAGRVRSAGMQPASPSPLSWQIRLPGLAQSVVMRAGLGGVRSAAVRVTVRARPVVQSLDATITAPGYLGLASVTRRNVTRIDAWQDSVVGLRVRASSPLEAASVTWPSETGSASPTTHALEAASADRREWAVELPAVASGPFGFELRDEQGLTSRAGGRPRTLMVRIDAPPAVRLEPEPRPGAVDPQHPDAPALDQVGPTDTLAMAFDATDDVAVARVEMHVAVERARGGGAGEGEAAVEPRVIELPGQVGTPHAAGQALRALGDLRLRGGDSVTYRLRVFDNAPPPRGPHAVWSDTRRVRVVAEAPPLLARRQAASIGSLRARLESLRQVAGETRRALEPLRSHAEAWKAEDEQAARDSAQAAQTLERDLRRLAEDLAKAPALASLSPSARRAAEIEASASRQALEALSAPEARAESRPEAVQTADNRLGALGSRLDALQRDFDQAAREAEARARLAEIAARQDALARQDGHAAQSHPRQEQEQIARDLQELVQQSPGLRAEALAPTLDVAEALAERARELADRQRAQARQTGDLDAHAAELADLAREQEELDGDARRLALDVDEVLARNQRARLDANATEAPVDPIRRGLMDQAGQRLNQAERELRRLGRDLANLPDDARALARRLADRQEDLRRDAAEAVRETVRNADQPTEAEAAALQARMEPIIQRQAELAGLLGGLPVDQDRREAQRQAAEAVGRAAEALKKGSAPRDVEPRQNEARDALRRLADAMPNPDQLANEVRNRAGDVRNRAGQMAQEIERHLRETSPQPGQARDPAQAATELENRLRPLAESASQAAADLESLADADPAQGPRRIRASRRLQALARGLAQGDREALPGLARDAREAADRLARSLNGETTADLVAAELAEEAAAAGANPARLATALRALEVPDAAAEQGEAVREAEQAAARPAGDPEAAGALARAVGRLRDRLNDDGAPDVEPAQARERADRGATPVDPGLGLDPGRAGAALELARRQRQIRERVQGLLGDRVPEQDAVRADSEALAKDVAALRETIAPLAPEAHGAAAEASDLLAQHAPGTMRQAVGQLREGQAEPARESQRRAAEQLERAAQRAEDLARRLKAAIPPGGGNPSAPAPQSLAEARQAQSQAIEALPSDDAHARPDPSALEAMRRAAQALQMAASAPAASPTSVAESADPNPTEAGPITAAMPTSELTAESGLAELQEALRGQQGGRDWAALPGHLRTEILEMARGGYRDDYERLIRLYFRQIAAEAADDRARGSSNP
jgi:hypothetical protein